MTIVAVTAAVVRKILDVIGMILPLLPIAFSDPNFGRAFVCFVASHILYSLKALRSYRLIPSRFKRRFVPGKFFARQAYSKALVLSL